MNTIDVKIHNQKVGELFFEKELNSFGFNYTKDYQPISLIMPYKSSSYIWKNKLHPIFDMNMPEGYLFEILKQYISKEHGYLDDFLVFSYLCSNMQSRLTYDSKLSKDKFLSFDMDEILKNDTEDTFSNLVSTYLSKNAISGVQPKSLALLEDKESFTTKEYIVKTWGEEYKELALNEYFCLKAIEKAGVKIPNIKLSKNNKFLVVERFNYDEVSDSFLGFEEILTLQGKNKDEKYSGSYEQVAKIVYSVSTNKLADMQTLFKIIVMNYLLKNGDAHLKNFGMLYDENIENIWLSPAYDVVNTVVYIYKDRPALTMFGKKVWFGKEELVKFGIESCYLSNKEANILYDECFKALDLAIDELELYIKTNAKFEDVGRKMLDSWRLSKDQKTYKEIPVEITRNWSKS
ncbi:MAG: type II toxin-antitoxin system HipA family toxin [Sulfurimonas sp.]|uniref:type II toxin-antitoxin system HipA family toxin n=1 Tax=Sulfurimonas sp. TaxID=2022749 RepID=UPI0025D7C432|nr:type II toxin-antitoxin system HipA family toxin [Sulfurimonas sp.]MCK9490672.1 type II toxin-antitoxin system HipA family toxin [Sulfurimonas sp.]